MVCGKADTFHSFGLSVSEGAEEFFSSSAFYLPSFLRFSLHAWFMFSSSSQIKRQHGPIKTALTRNKQRFQSFNSALVLSLAKVHFPRSVSHVKFQWYLTDTHSSLVLHDGLTPERPRP